LTGPVSVEIQLKDGSTVKRHFDQIHRKPVNTTFENDALPGEQAKDANAFVSLPTEDTTASSEIVTEETPPIDSPLLNSEDALSSFGTTDVIHNQPATKPNSVTVPVNIPIPVPRKNP